MKHIPILFSTPMVQAILDGRKTQTRRVVKQQPPSDYDYLGTDTDNASSEPVFYACWEGDKFHNVKCPYGQVGDVLWVRETFFITQNGTYFHKATIPDFAENIKWTPSIHMPKEAARIFLEITNIRVKRLQDISEQDAIAEGVDQFKTTVGYRMPTPAANIHTRVDSPTTAFKCLWRSINGADSWETNPWVWVVEFKRVEKPLNF